MAFVASLRLSVPSLWELVRDVRNSVKANLAPLGPDVQDAGVMAASELVENAIKYGHRVDGQEAAVLELSTDGGALRITMSSGISSPESARDTLDRVKFIQSAPDKHALYVQRLRELLTQHGGRSQLGLYRIASEGEFQLEAVVDGDVLRVTATRGLS